MDGVIDQQCMLMAWPAHHFKFVRIIHEHVSIHAKTLRLYTVRGYFRGGFIFATFASQIL